MKRTKRKSQPKAISDSTSCKGKAKVSILRFLKSNDCMDGTGIKREFMGALSQMITKVFLPAMTAVPMISALNGNEDEYATGMAVCTFVACMATIPLVAFCALQDVLHA